MIQRHRCYFPLQFSTVSKQRGFNYAKRGVEAASLAVAGLGGQSSVDSEEEQEHQSCYALMDKGVAAWHYPA